MWYPGEQGKVRSDNPDHDDDCDRPHGDEGDDEDEDEDEYDDLIIFFYVNLFEG